MMTQTKKHLVRMLPILILLVTFLVPLGVLAQNPFGAVTAPPGVSYYGPNADNLSRLVANLLKTAMVIAGLYAVINFFLAGYSFMSAGGDPKKIQDSWAKIYQTIIGLLFTVGAFIITAMVSWILFGDITYLLQLKVFGP